VEMAMAKINPNLSTEYIWIIMQPPKLLSL